MRSILTVASVAAWAMLATPSSPTYAAPADDDAPADTTTVSSHENHDNEGDFEHTIEHMWRHSRPLIGIQYGFGDLDRDGFQGDLASIGAIDVQLGFSVERRFAGEDALLHQSRSFAHVGNLASRLVSDLPGPAEVGTDLWRFGLGIGDGYGYRFADDRGRFVLQNAFTLGWYTLDLEGAAVGGLTPADAAMLGQFTSHTRYGDSWESAVEVGFGDMVALHAGFERSAIFPSFKIWYWLLSSFINHGALMAADMFVDEVEQASPYAAPVVRFILEGALQYAYYELREDEVNWPFDTEPPLAVEMFKLGVTTRF